MGSEAEGPQGPDLAGGIPLDQLRDGEPLLGHVDEEAVLLLRRGDEIHAIGATCTHYGGPLAEGLVVGETVRCPWHHACFSLKTGEALGAPALNPVARWKTEVRDGHAFVLDKQEEPPLAARGRAVQGPESVVIVGAGAAGSAAAEMLRREGYSRPITLIDPEDAAPYDRPNLSKDYLAGSAPEEWIPLRPEGFYGQHDIDRVLAEVASLDPVGGSLELADGRTLRYGALLLATGATPVRLQVPGANLPHVHTLRSLSDCRAIIAATGQAERAVVIGASFIGMEVAASLRGRDLGVTVVAPDSVPFERTLGTEIGAMLRALHEGHGVEFRLGRTVSEIDENVVRLDDGSRLEADLVVVGIGVRPDTRLAEAAGLEVEDGVLVNEYLESSVPNVFAAGDIARWPNPRTGERVRVEHWVVAQRLGQSAARNILGQRKPFADVPFFWTQHYDLPVAYVGHAARWDDARVEGDPQAHDCLVSYLRDGKTLAVTAVHRDRAALKAEAAMEAAS